jgi:catechol 2,3-dioxygenase
MMSLTLYLIHFLLFTFFINNVKQQQKERWNPYLISFKMHSGMRIGSPVLRVKNIDRILLFYEKGLGLHVNRRYQDGDDDDGGSDNLEYKLGFKQKFFSSDEPVLILHHDPNAKNAPLHSAGLYHFAILVPDRRSLASTYLALMNSGVCFDEFADHLVSESLYQRS